MSIIPSIKLEKNQADFCLSKIRQANTLLKKWATHYGNRKQREFCSLILKGAKDKICRERAEAVIPKNELGQFRQDRLQIIAIREEEHTILGGRSIELAILSGYARLVHRHAIKWKRMDVENLLELEDYEQEGFMALRDAIYSYDREDIKFITFAWVSIRNRMKKARNDANPMCPLTNSDLKLIQSYEKAKSLFNDYVTFDAVTKAMGLDEDDASRLSDIVTKVYSESQVVGHKSTNQNEEQMNDYTCLRHGIDVEADFDEALAQKNNIRDAIAKAGLTEFELTVLLTSMEPYYGWQTDIANKSTNPNTGKPYSRMWVTYALRSAQEKIRIALQGMGMTEVNFAG